MPWKKILLGILTLFVALFLIGLYNSPTLNRPSGVSKAALYVKTENIYLLPDNAEDGSKRMRSWSRKGILISERLEKDNVILSKSYNMETGKLEKVLETVRKQ